jgi:hypothetical protein
LYAQSKNFSTSAVCSGLFVLFVRMKVVEVIGRILTFLVSQILRRICSSRYALAALEVIFSRANRLAICGKQFGVGQVVLLSVSVFYVTNGARQTLNERGDTVVTFTAQTGRPVNGRAADLDFHSSFTFAR